MTALTVHGLSPKALQALRVRALENGRSAEAELIEILEELLCPEGRLQVGTALAQMSKASNLSNIDVMRLESAREADAVPPMWLG